MIANKNKKIGIWGYAIVGKAIARYAHEQGFSVSIMDRRTLTAEETKELADKNISFYHEHDKHDFFNSHDYLFSSPGINIANDYPTHKDKWFTELDVFAQLFNKPIIAVTGSIGKTSVTHMLATLFKLADIPTAVGGNIGIATFDLLPQKNSVDYALLEVSSAQLHYCSTFTPNLAIWTNIYPNHLDFHATHEEYLLAKYNIMAHQQPSQHALLHLSLHNQLPSKKNNQQTRSYFTKDKPDSSVFAQLTDRERIYYVDNNTIVRHEKNKLTPLIKLTDTLASFSFIENSILITAVADILAINIQLVLQVPDNTQLPEHRLEKVATINNVDFYNDSKATTTASTLAAVEKLKHRPLHLFLGGLSKGVDREPFVAQLQPHVKHIYCFGKEADELYLYCVQNNIPAQKCNTLDLAFAECIKRINNDDIVLLSPSGSSYDLYNNFEERGAHFKNLITRYLQ